MIVFWPLSVSSVAPFRNDHKAIWPPPNGPPGWLYKGKRRSAEMCTYWLYMPMIPEWGTQLCGIRYCFPRYFRMWIYIIGASQNIFNGSVFSSIIWAHMDPCSYFIDSLGVCTCLQQQHRIPQVAAASCSNQRRVVLFLLAHMNVWIDVVASLFKPIYYSALDREWEITPCFSSRFSAKSPSFFAVSNAVTCNHKNYHGFPTIVWQNFSPVL